MAESENPEEDAPKKKSKLPLIIGLVLAIVLGGGGFFATYSGMIGGAPEKDTHTEDAGHKAAKASAAVAFVPLDPLIVSLGSGGSSRHLRFKAQLEVAAPYRAEVEHLMPRILDVLNGYLRAVDVADLEERTALIRLRAQMLRRVQIVTGEGLVHDLLVTEFVLN